ncbi:MAG: hypothetical protein U0637_11235 [Phycisphaerales bacterium]
MSMACVVCAVAAVVSPAASRAQEVESVAGDVWLGSSLFTVEDLENLDEACRLKPEQKEASLELMRGAMARARTMSLRYYRGWMDQDWSEGEDEAGMAKAAQDYQEKMKKQQEDVVKLEKEVMGDLRALLETAQADLGWQRFERSRRRLIVRSAHTTMQQMAYQRNGDDGFDFAAFQGQEPLVDVVAMVRASKLSDGERAGLAEALEPYETGMDSLISDWRPLSKQHSRNQMFWWNPDGDKAPSKADIDKMGDLFKRMRQLQVRTARRVEEGLSGAAQERFQRQRLRRESRYRWMPAKRSPDVAAVLKLRSISADQKSQIDALIREADGQLLKFAIEDRHKQDEAVLLDKPAKPEEMWGQGDPERMKQEQKLRRKLSKDILALLTPEQRSAYDTGIENDQDLATAFDKRRGDADSPWEVDADLNPWQDMWQAQREEE